MDWTLDMIYSFCCAHIKNYSIWVNIILILELYILSYVLKLVAVVDVPKWAIWTILESGTSSSFTKAIDDYSYFKHQLNHLWPEAIYCNSYIVYTTVYNISIRISCLFDKLAPHICLFQISHGVVLGLILEVLIKCIRKVKYETEYEDEKCLLIAIQIVALVRFFRIVRFVAKWPCYYCLTKQLVDAQTAH
jgi:hypothetical protein